MGRGMFFIPAAYADTPDVNYIQLREYQHRYWRNAEHFSCITHYDPCDSVSIDGKSITLHTFALSLTEDNDRPL
jgi:hypothetical protein